MTGHDSGRAVVRTGVRQRAAHVAFLARVHKEQPVTCRVLPWALKQDVVEVWQRGFERKLLLCLLHDVLPLAPAVRRVHLPQVLAHQLVGGDSLGRHAHHACAFGVDAIHVLAKGLDAVPQGGCELPLQWRVLGATHTSLGRG